MVCSCCFSKNKLDNTEFHKGWGTRHTFVGLGFFGLAIICSIQNNIALAIVPMILQQSEISTSKNSIAQISKSKPLCTSSRNSTPETNFIDLFFDSKFDKFFNPDEERASRKDKIELEIHLRETFNWTEAEQGVILGSFYYGYITTQYIGGRFGHRYGGKWVFSLGVLLSGISSLLLPFLTIQFGSIGLICVRIFQGCALGVTGPSIQVMLAHWSPLYERSSLSNVVYSGSPFGSAISLICGGYLIQSFQWPSIFYLAGGLSVIWFVFWTVLVFSTPSKHPRISDEELNFIQLSSDNNANGIQKNVPTPWKSILQSAPVWAILVLQIGQFWGKNIVQTEIPKYLRAVHGLQIHHIGWIAALPQILNCLFGTFIAYISDLLIKRGLTSVIFTRRLCATIAGFGSAAVFLGMGFGGCDTSFILISFWIGGIVSGAFRGSGMVNTIDISPNHAGTIVAIAGTASYLLSMVAPYATGLLLSAYPTLTGWQFVFLIGALTNFLSAFTYLLFSSGDEQKWNRTE